MNTSEKAKLAYEDKIDKTQKQKVKAGDTIKILEKYRGNGETDPNTGDEEDSMKYTVGCVANNGQEIYLEKYDLPDPEIGKECPCEGDYENPPHRWKLKRNEFRIIN